MKKKNNKKLNKNSFIEWLKITVLTGLGMLLIFTITMLAVGFFWSILYKLGVITETNFKRVYLYDFVSVTIILGSLISVGLIRMPITWTTNLIKAIKNIAHGNYDTRLKHKKLKSINIVVDEFNNMAQKLENTEMMSHDFINNFSHEFKTPVNSIHGFAKLLKNNELTDEQKDEYLNIIIEESSRLSGLANNILNLSKLENQSVLTKKEAVNVAEQIRKVIGSLYNKWHTKNIEIILATPEILINCNSEMLELVWINLIDNAIKFSPENEKIAIELSKNKHSVNILITNKGPVIDSAKAEKLFDKFYQTDESHSTNGNGLGLTITKRIIDLHNGEISLKNSDASGTTFSVSLPIK